MSYAYVPFTTWFTGLLNGHRHKEQGLPNSIVYSVLGTSSFISMLRSLASIDTIPRLTRGQMVVGIFVGVPTLMGATFFLGDQMGQAIRYVDDQKKGVKTTLV